MARKHDLEFPVLSDEGNEVARRFGLVYECPDDLREVYLSLGADLEKYNGDDSWTLPMPGRFVADANGVIRHAEAHPDHTRRPEPSDTVEQIRALAGDS